ncbi:helix-turn-helix domain-containing protein [Vitiosangium sp. GDMCC 1.1324]|uniref:winged helix-turn-helix transcriptional regulator n=1 Tax=Vitiosangium sp. (strain GDMCC 1.1324) TaxID=2138576 RepID=UPI000D3C0CF7|nr:helix-turn-helix domain-containing protein [Vitiosangium sp. GDMCC 1.1324]PTL75855.1 transcriptional regulator [Vitiosangium sp. GDMCC 1.1324]
MRRTSFADEICPIARALEVVGDWWTLLVVREALTGTTRFDDFRTQLGIARNILAARLESLVEHGVLERRRYEEHPPRDEYVLTDKGRDLWRVVSSLAAWGMRWEGEGAKVGLRVTHADCGHSVRVKTVCPHCEQEVDTPHLQTSRRKV